MCRCLVCAKYYCRECVIEYDDRLICAACLRKLTQSSPQTRALGHTTGVVCTFTGLLLAWIFFYYAGQVLILIPSAFHEGTVWQK